MKFADLPQVAQDCLRERFLSEARETFASWNGDMLDEFMALPEIAAQWQQFQQDAWDKFIGQDAAEEEWHEWLRDHDITP